MIDEVTAKVNALIRAAWVLDEVAVPIDVLQAIEAGRSLTIDEFAEAAEALGMMPSELARVVYG